MITIVVEDGRVLVKAPYNTEFPRKAGELGGRWNGSRWDFDERDLESVRRLCWEWFGEDGDRVGLVTIRVCVEGDLTASAGPVTLAGRVIASAKGRDTGAKLGEGVVLLEGRASGGGSVKNWQTVVHQGAVFLVRDFPAHRVEDIRDWRFSVSVEKEKEEEEEENKEAEKDDTSDDEPTIAQVERALAVLEAAGCGEVAKWVRLQTGVAGCTAG